MPLIGAIEKQHNRWNRKKIEQGGGEGGRRESYSESVRYK